LPFLAETILAHGGQRCAECASGRRPPELPGKAVSAAAENEVRSALSSRWRIVTSATAQPYLDRIARQVAERIDGAPATIRVVMVDAPEHRTLALPSGTLLVATGVVSFLEDEAELTFVLGHEVAHAASGEAAVRLVRLGFQATARERGGSDGLCWSDAAVDLARLGYGRRRERDADSRALEALLALDYEPASVIRYLRRLADAAGRGEAAVAETLIAHPPPIDRIRRIEKSLYGRVGVTNSFRVNREVFRRAAGPGILATTLVKGDLEAPEGSAWGMTGLLDGSTTILGWRLVAWVAAAVVAVAALAAWLLR
jgi:predicted Zn-dependent protease